MNELYEGIAVGKENEQLVEVSGRSEIHKNKKKNNDNTDVELGLRKMMCRVKKRTCYQIWERKRETEKYYDKSKCVNISSSFLQPI